MTSLCTLVNISSIPLSKSDFSVITQVAEHSSELRKLISNSPYQTLKWAKQEPALTDIFVNNIGIFHFII